MQGITTTVAFLGFLLHSGVVVAQDKGNLFAHPTDLFDATVEDRLDPNTDVIEFGAQFSF